MQMALVCDSHEISGAKDCQLEDPAGCTRRKSLNSLEYRVCEAMVTFA